MGAQISRMTNSSEVQAHAAEVALIQLDLFVILLFLCLNHAVPVARWHERNTRMTLVILKVNRYPSRRRYHNVMVPSYSLLLEI